MQEKRLRQLEERARGSPEAGPQKDPAQDESERKVPDGGSPSPPPSTTPQAPPPSTTQTSSTTTKLPVRKLISLRSKAALGRNGDTATATTTTTTAVSARGASAAAATAFSSLPTNQSSVLQQRTDRDAPSQAKRARTLPPGGAADVPAPRDNQEKLSSPVKGTSAPPPLHIHIDIYCPSVCSMGRQRHYFFICISFIYSWQFPASFLQGFLNIYLYRKCSIHFKNELATRHDRKWGERL